MIDCVTGANGFIGRHLMSRIGQGAIAVPHEKIHDTAFPNCDRFFFLSTYGNMAGQNDLSEILSANIGNLGYVLGAYIEESKCEHFTFVSSSSVLLEVQTPYSHAKRAGEEMVLALGIKACCVRPFSVTGVGEQAEHLIPTLIRSCMEREPMQFVADAWHDWIDVEDVVDGMITLADARAIGTFELGTGISYSNEAVKEMVEAVCFKKANVRPVDSMREYDSKDWVCRDTRAQMFGWTPKKSLQQSIEEMVAAYKFRRKQA